MYPISNLKCNRINNPIGYQFNRLSLSFEVNNNYSEAKEIILEIAKDNEFMNVIKTKYISLIDRIGVLIDIDFLEPKTRYFWRLRDGNACLSPSAYFETGLMQGFEADFLTTQEENIHPEFHKTFELKQPIMHARMYITGVGLYTAFLNDKKVGNEYLTPYCNDYDEFIQYQTYEINNLIIGHNHIKVMLGNGWYKGKFGLDQKENIFGKDFGVLMELHVTYQNGESDIIKSDKSWSAKSSPILSSSIYDGERQDYTKDSSELRIAVTNQIKEKVKERISIPIKKQDVLKPTLIINDQGEKILDFNQNMVGFVKINSKIQADKTITLKFGEILQNGRFYRENLRSAKAEFSFVSDGVSEVYQSHFTYYGFRYVKVEGMEIVDPNDFEGVVIYSDIENTGELTTSSELLNKLYENVKWGQKGNFIDVPTDCPQRDERLGWTADAQVFSKTACYNMDSLPFYEKYVNDLMIDQKLYNGGLPNYSPSFKEGMESGSVWGDAATIIPMNLYKMYGDVSLLKKHYPLMKRYVMRLIERDENHGDNRLYDDGFHFGDWLAQDGMSPQSLKGGTDDTYIASMYYYYSLSLASEAANILGETQDEQLYKKYVNEVRDAILGEYFSPNGRLSIDTQTGYVLSLYLNVYISREKLLQGFKERLKKDYYRIKTGFVGTPLICKVLLQEGLREEAYRLLFEENSPSWLYQVNLGATTVWERWNSVLSNGEISGTNMNSLNHYAYGAVMECVYEDIAGLKPIAPGFSKVMIEPKPHYQLKCVSMNYQSAFGLYHVSWRILEDATFTLKIEAPIGSEVQVILPDFESELTIIEGEVTQSNCDILTMKSSVFHCKYKMNQNHLTPFSADSVILDLLKNHEAQRILKDFSPVLYDFVTGENDEFLPSRLNEITYLPMCYTPNHIVDKIDEELRKVRV